MVSEPGWASRAGARLPTWQELTKEQQCVLFSAAEHSMLIGVLANWEPSQSWLARRDSVGRLADAAIALVEAGLIEVLEGGVPPHSSFTLPESQAVEELANPVNWWRDDEPETKADAGSEVALRWLELATTGKAEAVFRTRGDEDLYAFLVH